MIEKWLAVVIVLSVFFGIILLILIACKGHDLCHRQKKMGVVFMFISLNFFGLFWANKIFKKENPEKYQKSINEQNKRNLKVFKKRKGK